MDCAYRLAHSALFTIQIRMVPLFNEFNIFGSDILLPLFSTSGLKIIYNNYEQNDIYFILSKI